MHASQRTLFPGQRIIDLRKRVAKTVVRELIRAETTCKEATIVTTFFQFNGIGAG